MRKLLIGGMVAAAVICTPSAQAYSGDQASAEQAVTAIYNRVQRGCTPSMPPSLQSISWDNFNPDAGGAGTIHDANPQLGGAFQVAYWNEKVGPAHDSPPFRAYGQWGVNLEFC
ncbi:MAG TPA: hypothetical protein VGG53_18010 [Mycobacterium sp.]|uniref:hypothetical protein n=1 Tax=Mycobacterium sp. TaxID=1785 RepID=UPI002F3F544E